MTDAELIAQLRSLLTSAGEMATFQTKVNQTIPALIDCIEDLNERVRVLELQASTRNN